MKTNGERIKVKGKIGDSLLDVVVNNSVDLDGFGACEGTLTCSTCHLIFKEKDYNELPDKPSDEELDMLDLAYDLTDTSRLGCQIFLSEKHDGLEVVVPATINDAREWCIEENQYRKLNSSFKDWKNSLFWIYLIFTYWNFIFNNVKIRLLVSLIS